MQNSRQENLRVYDRLIPPTISLFTQPYTDQTSVTTSNLYDPQEAYASYRAGMDELEADTLRKIQLLVPSDSQIPEMCGLLQQGWQQALAVSVNIVEVSRDELSSRLSLGTIRSHSFRSRHPPIPLPTCWNDLPPPRCTTSPTTKMKRMMRCFPRSMAPTTDSSC